MKEKKGKKRGGRKMKEGGIIKGKEETTLGGRGEKWEKRWGKGKWGEGKEQRERGRNRGKRTEGAEKGGGKGE